MATADRPGSGRPRPGLPDPDGVAALAADLPIADAVGALRAALATGTRAVLHAPPGAGKTTIVPLVLAAEPWCEGTVVVLEPRRLAVRGAATRLSSLVGDRPGGLVGWRMRQDTKVSAATRIEVVTEGVLTRRLQHDPSLEGVSAVVFDEFHERSLDADLGLALALDAAGALAEDLRILVMSATLDTGPVADLLGEDGRPAPVVASEGRRFPVDVVHVDVDRRARVEATVAPVVARAVGAHGGDVLVFLPGAAEIDRVGRALEGTLPDDVDVRPLHGSLPPEVQDAAIAPSPSGRRKVVLSTSIAETSLTIEGVTVVVDAGWRRAPRLDPGSGMSRLVTLPVTRAEADQRAGRAGRLAPGTAYRCWSRAEHATLRAHPEPEIEVADLTPLALELAAWGATEDELAWPTAPPPAHLAAARDLLVRLEALAPAPGGGATGPERLAITEHGRELAALPLHPRLAQLVQRGAALGHGALAVDLAAALHEHALGSRSRTDVAARLVALVGGGGDGRRRAAARRAQADAQRWRRRTGVGGSAGEGYGDPRTEPLGLLLALGFPDRIGRARPDARGEVLLANGRGAFVDDADPLADAPWLVAAELDGRGRRARIRAAAPTTEDEVRRAVGHEVTLDVEVGWDRGAGDVVAREVERLGAIELVSRPLQDPPPATVAAGLVEGLRQEGLDLLGWSDDDRRLQQRLAFLHRLDPGTWPDVSDDAVLADAEARIVPHLAGRRRRRDLAGVDVAEVLLAGLGWHARQRVDELAPERLRVPSGNRHRVDYATDPPVLAAKLQELFGSTDTPTVGGGRVPVVLHLLSPAGRPLQVTQDLASFWAGAYAQVRADMRGRYPKHPWPEDPATAEPTARTARRREGPGAGRGRR